MPVVDVPVAGTVVSLRRLVGTEEILLLEAERLDLHLALALFSRLVQTLDGVPLDGWALSISDVDALLLRLRQQVVGDLVRTDTVCSAPGCGRRVDVNFSIQDYLEYHAPVVPVSVVPTDEAGWYRLTDNAAIELRPPCVADQLAIAVDSKPLEALWTRCVRGGKLSEDTRQQVEAAMESIAPSLCAELSGTCSECGTALEFDFDPLQYTLGELRDRAAYLYDDVATIAHHYHWSEAEILTLPAARRAGYAELATEYRMRDRH